MTLRYQKPFPHFSYPSYPPCFANFDLHHAFATSRQAIGVLQRCCWLLLGDRNGGGHDIISILIPVLRDSIGLHAWRVLPPALHGMVGRGRVPCESYGNCSGWGLAFRKLKHKAPPRRDVLRPRSHWREEPSAGPSPRLALRALHLHCNVHAASGAV